MSSRTIMGAALGVALASPAQAQPDDVDRPTLSATEIQKYFAPYRGEVKDCYVTTAGPAASGTLRLELVIHRDGTIFRFGFAAPGVTGPWLRKLDGCLRPLSTAWHFPVRRGFTTAVIPMVFQRVNPPDQPRATCPGEGPCIEGAS